MISRKKTSRDNSHAQPAPQGKKRPKTPATASPANFAIDLVLKTFPGITKDNTTVIQAKNIYNSLSYTGQQQIADNFGLELSLLDQETAREQLLRTLAEIDPFLPPKAAYAMRLLLLKKQTEPLHLEKTEQERFSPLVEANEITTTLSMVYTIKDNIRTRRVAILAADGVSGKSVKTMKEALEAEGAETDIIAPIPGYVLSEEGESIPAAKSFATAASVFYDAVYVPRGWNSVFALEKHADAQQFLYDAFRLSKPIAADEQARLVLEAALPTRQLSRQPDEENGIIIENNLRTLCRLFIKAVARHRFWNRDIACPVSA